MIATLGKCKNKKTSTSFNKKQTNTKHKLCVNPERNAQLLEPLLVAPIAVFQLNSIIEISVVTHCYVIPC